MPGIACADSSARAGKTTGRAFVLAIHLLKPLTYHQRTTDGRPTVNQQPKPLIPTNTDKYV